MGTRPSKVSSVPVGYVQSIKLSILKNSLTAPSTDLPPTSELFPSPTLLCLVMSGMSTPPAGCFMPRWLQMILSHHLHLLTKGERAPHRGGGRGECQEGHLGGRGERDKWIA